MTRAAYKLFRSVHSGAPRVTRATLTIPRAPTGMGSVVSFEVCRAGGCETWAFRPMPRVAFTRVTRDTNGWSKLWIVGGRYRVDGSGLHNTTVGPHLERLPVTELEQRQQGSRARYRRTHGGLDAREAVVGTVRVPDTLVNVGKLSAITYHADKDEGGGVWPYRHAFADDAAPDVCVDASGTQIFIVGGRYTVTAHGIEDRP